jgi:hypothetical protein
MSLSNQSKNRVKYLDRLIETGWIAKEFPNEKKIIHLKDI